MSLIGAILLTGCDGTGPSPPGPGPEPRGWIYGGSDSLNHDATPGRVNVETGEFELLTLPTVFHLPNADYSIHSIGGFASPMNGDLTGRARIDGIYPVTFVLDARTQELTTYADYIGYGVTVDAEHSWSPDGQSIVFTRHQATGGGFVLALLHPYTGVIDTLMTDLPSTDDIIWLGSDTLILEQLIDNPPDTERRHVIRSLDIATKQMAEWNYPWNNFTVGQPVASPDRNWIAFYVSGDTTLPGTGTFKVNRLHLYDRHAGEDTTLNTLANTTRDPIPGAIIVATFDPTSHYLAYCKRASVVRIFDLAQRRAVKDLEVPYCYGLTWSWGPEGPPGRSFAERSAPAVRGD